VQRSLLGPPASAAPATGVALFAKGFRPFFLLAAAYVALALPLWVVALSGRVELGAYFGGTYWHAHEMVFGFASAVIAGFLLTAVGNWTGRETATGPLLAALALLWIAGRIVVLVADRLPRPLVATIDLAFLPALAFACARPIVSSKNRRNYVFLAMLAALFGANLAMHLGASRKGAWVGVELETLMIVVITGRVVPMFTKNATGAAGIQSSPRLDRAAALGVALVVLGEALSLDERGLAAVSAATGVVLILRARAWWTRQVLRHPLLWALHLAHAFVALGLVLRLVSLFVPALSPSAALHALTAGGIGLATLGMMSRVSLGHTGRMLAAPRAMSLAFGLVALAALVRVLAPLFGPGAFLHCMTAAGVAFALGFGLFLFFYLPMLVAPRVDGKPG
jgi:uncharacterized protein involved in response to NO